MKKNDLKAKTVKTKDLIGYNESSVISRTIIDKPSGTITAFSFDKGQGLSEHTSPYDATVQILDGEATLVIGGRDVRVGAGELVIMPAHVPHAVRAEQRFKRLRIMIR